MSCIFAGFRQTWRVTLALPRPGDNEKHTRVTSRGNLRPFSEHDFFCQLLAAAQNHNLNVSSRGIGSY